MPVKRSQEDLIKLLREKFGDRFDYSEIVYVNNVTPIKITCKKHNTVFYPTPKHLLGMNKECGCTYCTREYLSIVAKKEKVYKKKRTLYTTETYIEAANIKHNYKYDYSKTELKYIKNGNCPRKLVSNKNITIICPEHGEFQQDLYWHLAGYGCPSCANKGRYLKNAKTTEQFIKDAKKIHGDKYDYTLSKYVNRATLIKIVCPIHGEFEQLPMNHLAGKGCFLCGKGTTQNNENRVKYILSHHFPDLEIIQGYRDKKIFGRQHLDFYIPSLNIAIEYQGPQHFERVEYLEDYRHNYNHTHELDEIKFNKCKSLGIQLLYFTFNKKYENVKFFDKVYTNIDDIVKIINDKLNSNE